MRTDDDAQEASVPVRALLPWLSRTDVAELIRMLVGCDLDDGESENLARIEGVAAAAGVLVVEGGRRVNLRKVIDGSIVDRRPGYPLLVAIESTKTPAERREAQVRAELRRRRVEPDSLGSAADREQVLGFLVLVEQEELPAEPSLRAFYEAMKPAASAVKHRRAAEVLQALMAACVRHGDVPASLPWRLAWFLNQSGQLDETVAATETPHARAVEGMNRAYLATIRASALLALARMRHDGKLLDQAEAALQVAYAIDGGSDEVKAVYRELNRTRAARDEPASRAR